MSSDTKDQGKTVHPLGDSVGLRLREYAAIHLCVPDSGDARVDRMIRDSLRDKLAMAAPESAIKAMQEPTTRDRPGKAPILVGKYTSEQRRYMWADRMLAAREARTWEKPS